MDDRTNLKYKKCKYKVKKWESEFKTKHGVNPSKRDIKQAPWNIKEAYRIYFMLKTQALESNLLDEILDENAQDSFSLIDNSNSETSFNLLEDNVSQTGANSFFRSILEDTTVNNLSISGSDNINDSEHLLKVKDVIEPDSGGKENESNLPADSVPEGDNSINPENVWGGHLSKKSDFKEKKAKISYKFSEKLFQNFSVKLRNPRKENPNKRKSIVNDKAKVVDGSENSNLNTEHSIDNRVEESDKCNINYETVVLNEVNITNNELIESSTTKDASIIDNNITDTEESAFKILDEKVKVVIKSTPNRVKQISTNVSCNLQTSKSSSIKLRSSFDKGWLERINCNNKLMENSGRLSSETLVDSGFESAESSYVNNSTIKSVDSNVSDENKSIEHVSESEIQQGTCNTESNEVSDSDDDIVSNSDDETNCKSLSFLTMPSKVVKRTYDVVENKSCSEMPSLKRAKVDMNSTHNVDTLQCVKTNTPNTFSNIFNENSVSLVSKKVNSILETNDNDVTRKVKPMSDIEKKEALLRKKLESGKANKNFVRINIQKKVYVRGKKTMNFSKYKKNQWKKKRSQLYDGTETAGGEAFKCFKCGDVGHYARYCSKGLDKLIPKEDIDNEDQESPFPTLEEAEEMARETADRFRSKKQLVNSQNEYSEENKESEKDPLVGSLETEDCNQPKLSTVLPLLKTNEDNSLIDTPLIVYQALQEFGHSEFQPGQEMAIMRILSGFSTLVTLSTGSGKSLCYQLPAYLFQKLTKTPCITIVVSPLVSLMEDQITCMSNAPIKMGCLHMNQTAKQRAAVIEELKSGELAVLILSPETIVSVESGPLAVALQSIPPITFVCIDEVHCVSQWSHNFRPSYLVLCKVLKERFKVKTFLGLTATATKSTIEDIIDHLSLPDGSNGVISNTPLPSNLTLTVSKDYNREEALVKLLQSKRFRYPFSVIVYCTRREECEKVAMYIRTSLQDEVLSNGVKKGRLSSIAEPYHAGLTAHKRKQVQKLFTSGQLRIVVATIAFGMGINKQNVRGIIHYNLPSSFESYVQEVGRAGRDGLAANCHMFLDARGGDLNELRRHIFANSVDRHTLRKLLQRIFVPCKCKTDCVKHETSFSIDDTVKALDVKEETIMTLLCYLELHNRKWITNLPHCYTNCKVQSYKGAKHLRTLARKCPPLAVAVASELKNGANPDKLNHLNFHVVELASLMNWDSGTVKYHLKQLEWASSNGVRFKTGLLVEFSDLGFRVKAPGNLSNEELDSTLDGLYQRVKDQETASLAQLQIIFETLSKLACKTVEECLDEGDKSKSDQLKEEIRNYFERSIDDAIEVPTQVKLENEDQIASDIRCLVTSYKDCSFTGRSVARIFHGIPSPNFPAIVMGRSRFWRAYLDQDFMLLCQLASRKLIRLR